MLPIFFGEPDCDTVMRVGNWTNELSFTLVFTLLLRCKRFAKKKFSSRDHLNPYLFLLQSLCFINI